MKKLDWYIIRKFLGTFFFAILILAIISCVIDYSEKIEAFVSRKVPTPDILNYYKNFVPHITALLFPLFIFIATIFFTSKLAYKSEIIAMLAGGVSFQRFLRPYIIGGGFLCIGSALANHFVIPKANKDWKAFEDKYIHGALIVSDQNVHLRLSKEQYVFMRHYDYTYNMGYNFGVEKIEGTILKEKLTADRASYDSVKKIWHLFNVVVRVNNNFKEELQFLGDVDRQYPFVPKDLKKDEAIKEALTTPELNKYIAKEKLRGRENLSFYYIEKYRRDAEPFGGFILTIIGACIASRKIRGGSGLHLAFGIVISAAYVIFQKFAVTFSTNASLNPFIAIWIPNILCGGLAVYLYRKQVT